MYTVGGIVQKRELHVLLDLKFNILFHILSLHFIRQHLRINYIIKYCLPHCFLLSIKSLNVT